MYQKLTTLGIAPTLFWASKERDQRKRYPYLSFFICFYVFLLLRGRERRFQALEHGEGSSIRGFQEETVGIKDERS